MTLRNLLLPSLSIVAVAAFADLAQAQVKIACVSELSGPGATVGINFRNGANLAIDEINAAGGLLGQKIEMNCADSQTNPGVARGLVQKALDANPYAVLGPVYSGSIKVTAQLTSESGVTNVIGGEAAELTQMGLKTLIRTSFGQQISMPKLAAYMADDLKAKNVAVIWVNNDFGKGGRDGITKELKARGVTISADISTEAAQVDFAADVAKLKQAEVDAVFIYLHEEESARILKEIQKQGIKKPLIGETTLLNQKVIELAGDAANGVRGHVGLTADAPIPSIEAYRHKFMAKYNYVPDHNSMKGYLGIYTIKAGTQKMGKLDPKGLTAALKGLSVKAADEPGMLMDVSIDQNGDLDRIGFLAEVQNGTTVITKTLPALKP
ncbi:amino acid/amide ABC transporter substrate-binding protein, HAAT family [Bosea lupini]|uniref:Amino acid/amide ABC transporter substrate-binding protein, HAAT family n=1 Tax=Bosea lupini TaxID=1036779 RepID=A0A1H7U0D5_9HYPH|nr:amino acid/amide ABC transporter substrate-binding protein, HAAT family [Bosea lupini]